MLDFPAPAEPLTRMLLPAIVAFAAQHGVEAVDAGGDALLADRVVQAQRADRQDGQAVLVDHGRVFVRAVSRAAVFDDAQTAGGHLAEDAVIEEDDAIADVFLEAVAGQRVASLLASDDGGDALVLEPAKETPQFGAEDGFVGQAGEQSLEAVEHHAPGADLVDQHAQGGRTNPPGRIRRFPLFRCVRRERSRWPSNCGG